jgi:cytochrome b561
MNVPVRNTESEYGAVAQAFHWAVVIGILLQFAWAWRIDQTDSIRQQFALVNEHKSIGMTVLLLAALRLGWRLFSRPPPFPGAMRGWERRAASVAHVLLYGLIFAMPLSGWAYSSAAGYGAEFWGLLDIPDFVPQGEQLESVLGTVHQVLAVSLLTLAALHAAAALRHHFVLHDNILRRMLPPWNS